MEHTYCDNLVAIDENAAKTNVGAMHHLELWQRRELRSISCVLCVANALKYMSDLALAEPKITRARTTYSVACT